MMTIAFLASAGWHDGRGWDGPPWPVFFLVPLLLLTVIVVGLLLLRSRRPLGAVEIVATRYARGEIDEAEYRRRDAELQGKSSPRKGHGNHMSSTAMKLSAMSNASKVNVGAMAAAIVAIVIQIAAGVDYPPIPPGPIILAVAIGLVVFAGTRWALVVAVIVPLFLIVGGTLASILNDDNALRHPDDVVPFAATALQMAAVIVAFAAGLQAYRRPRS